MHAERTPNPQSIKWVTDRDLAPAGVGAHFTEAPGEAVSPLATRLFAVDGVRAVFLAGDFVTVTKQDELEWDDVAGPVVEVLRAFLLAGSDALGPAYEPGDTGGTDEVVGRIRRLLDEEIRPAVAMDGGDVVFAGFREGVVEVVLRGACAGCPSSAQTLKQGIELRLREAIPEVRGVVAL
jgi:Fe-S cluster biogenesis protein NfuA